MLVNLTFEYNTKGHGSKTAFKNFIKGLNYNKVELVTNSFRKDVDLIHAQIPGPISYIQSFLRKKDLIYSLHFHQTELDLVKGGRFMGWLSGYYLRRAKVITVPSKFGKVKLEKFIKRKPISVISNGVDLRIFNKDSSKRKKFRDAYGIDKDEFVIYNVGSFNHKKGVINGVNCLKASSTSEFRNAINNILTDKNLFRKLSTASYKTALKHDLRKVGDKLKRIYELVLDNNFKPFYNDYGYENNLV